MSWWMNRLHSRTKLLGIKETRPKRMTQELYVVYEKREGEYDSSVMRKLRRVEKGSVGVTCDVVANTVEWTNKRQGITKVSVCICINLYLLKVIYIHIIPIQVFGSPFVPSRRMRKYLI